MSETEACVNTIGENPWLFYNRALLFGVSYHDLARIGNTACNRRDWGLSFGTIATEYDAMAKDACNMGHIHSAMQWLRSTVVYAYFAQAYLNGKEKRKYQQLCGRAYDALALGLKPGCRKVFIPFRAHQMPGYIRHVSPDAPCVIITGALKSSKEMDLHLYAEAFVKRGMSVMYFDVPGLGELDEDCLLPTDMEATISAAIDFLVNQKEPVDLSRIGLFSFCFGAYFGTKAAVLDERISAYIGLSGFYHWRTADRLSPINQKILAAKFGFKDLTTFTRPDSTFTLNSLPKPIEKPFFIIHGTRDHLVPDEQAYQMRDWARGETRLWMVDGAEHVCFSRLRDILPVMSDWMAEKLRVGGKPS